MATKKILKETPPAVSIDNGFSFPAISNFTIKATIRTGDYSNIETEMTVNGVTFEDIDTTLMPRIEAMYAKYHNFTERPPVVNVQAPVAPVTPETTEPEQSVVYLKALSAIKASHSKEALLQYHDKVVARPDLTEQEKEDLLKIISDKLNA